MRTLRHRLDKKYGLVDDEVPQVQIPQPQKRTTSYKEIRRELEARHRTPEALRQHLEDELNKLSKAPQDAD